MLKPIGNRVIIKQFVKENKSELIMLEDFEEKLPRGEIIAVGDGEEVVRFCVGDKVLFNRLSGEPIEDEGSKYLILKSSEILAKIC